MARILVVEDDPQNLYLASYLLRAAGHDVLFAGDGEEAVEVALAQEPDVVLMDILLPKADGYEAMRRIRESRDARELPIVAVTAYAMPDDERKARAAGAQGHISKPIEPATFVEQVEGFLIEGA